MAFQSVPNTIEAVVKAVLAGQNVFNTFYAYYSGGYTSTEVQDVADAIDEWFGTEMLPYFSADYSYLRTDARGLENEIDSAATANANAGVGANAEAALPNNAAFCIARKSIFTGRGARGRVYLSGMPYTAQTAGNVVSAALVTAWVDALNALKPWLAGIGAIESIVHRSSGGVLLDPATTFAVDTYVAVDNVFDSMRRRLPGRGS